MSNTIRISKKLTQMFPAEVVTKINDIAADYRIKAFTLETVSEDKVFVIGEGEKYTGISADGRTAGFEVVSANTIGASGLSHRINSQFAMPAGSYLIRVSYYTKYFMDVYQISPKMIGA